jgi:hypothetical protein
MTSGERITNMKKQVTLLAALAALLALAQGQPADIALRKAN